MSKPLPPQIEYRNYLLPPYFPIIVLTGEVWRISDKPSGVLHFHNCPEIGLCESDSGFLQLGSRTEEFHAGDITFIGSDIAHTTWSAPGTRSKWSYLFVNVEDLFASYFPLDIITDVSSLWDMLRDCSAIFPASEYPEISALVLQILDEMVKKPTNFQFTVRGLMLSLMMKLLNLYTAAAKEPGKTAADRIHPHDNALSISPALFYIRKNFMLDFSQEDLAVLCHMSPSHFRRTFKSIMGLGSLEYTNNMRMKYASTLLRTTEKPVLDISEESGYHSLSSFNRHFMEMFDMTPMQYRKQMSCVRDKSALKCTGWMLPQ